MVNSIVILTKAKALRNYERNLMTSDKAWQEFNQINADRLVKLRQESTAGGAISIPSGFSNSDLAWAITFSLLLGFMIGFMGAFYVL